MTRTQITSITLILLVLITACSSSRFKKSNATEYPGLTTITTDDLLKTVEDLCAPELTGRLPGSDGYRLAASYIAKQFADLGLEPGGDDQYLQHFSIEYNQIQSPARLDLMKGGQAIKQYQLGDDYIGRGFTGAGTFTAPVVFCGYGISAPENGYDDLAEVEIDGKLVVAFKYAPQWQLGDNTWGNRHLPRVKSRLLADHGALGLLLVSFPDTGYVRPPIGSVLHGPGEQDTCFPQLHIDQHVAADLFIGSGITLAQLREQIDQTQEPHSRQLATEMSVEIHTEYVQDRDTYNVIGILRGSDPTLADEYLIIGAHLDHVGSQGGDIYFPGANDNASGSASVLEIAEAFIAGNVRPKRSLVFILFSGEEQGLNGARHYANHPAVPLDKTIAMFNLDCVAYGDSLRVGSGRTAPKLWQIARDLDAKVTQQMISGTWGGGGADATPFHEKGLPTLYFVTTNSYDHLHALTDKPETLNGPLHEKLTRLCYLTALHVANGLYKREELVVTQ